MPADARWRVSTKSILSSSRRHLEPNAMQPISLSNSIYLIIAKVVATRLREVLDGLISPFQSAFIPGWQMLDSIILAEEMVAAWRRSGTTGFMWKVDFAKSLRLHQLEIPLECSAAARIPRGMGAMDQAMCYCGLIPSSCEWTAPWGMVPAAKGHQTRMSACTAVVHIGR